MKKSKKNSQLKEVWRRFRKSKTALLGLVLLVVVILIALLADVIVPYETAIAQEPASRLQGPSAFAGYPKKRYLCLLYDC